MKSFINLSKLFIFLMAITFSACNDESSPTDNGDNGGGDNTGNEVLIRNNSFSPATLTIAKGTTVVFKNQDGVVHTATSGIPGSPSGVFNSGNLNSGSTYSFTFNDAGTFQYFCALHTQMRGTIIVQ